MNIENEMNQIPMGVLQNVTNMLSFEDDILSDEDGRLGIEELKNLREKMKEQLNVAYEDLINKLSNISTYEFQLKNYKIDIKNIIYNFGLKLIEKISTRYQNAHVRITFKTVTEYVCEEIQESEILSLANEISEVIKCNEKVLQILKEEIKILENNFKLINIPSEQEVKEKSNSKPIDISDPTFVEKSVKYAEYLLDNEGKNSMINYVRSLAEQLVKKNN